MELITRITEVDNARSVDYTTPQGEQRKFHSRRMTLHSGFDTLSAEMIGERALNAFSWDTASLYKVSLAARDRTWTSPSGELRHSNEMEIVRIEKV